MDIKELAKDTAAGGSQFVEQFYQIYDDTRHDLYKFYADSSILLWNGRKIVGKGQIDLFFKELPNTKHDINCLDCHFIEADIKSILVSCNGTVSHDKGMKRSFHQVILLTPNPSDGTYYVAQDTFRFVE